MRSRTTGDIAAALWRELDVRSRVVRTERALDTAARTGGRVLLGPFLGEVGYELLYWIPFLRRELRRRGIEPEQAVVMTRGGAAVWYRDFARDAIDILEVVDDYLPRLEQRRSAARDLKQLRVETFDRELATIARERLGPFAWLHPSLMFARLRGLWFGGLSPEDVWDRLEYRRLDAPGAPAAALPERYVAVKAYFNEVLPGSDPNRAALRAALEELAQEIDVVLLATGLAVDDHEELDAVHPRVHSVGHLLRPADNLAVQTQLVAGARGLLATYGGFSYLAPFLGVPALALLDVPQTVPVHLEVLRKALPDARYDVVRISDAVALRAWTGRL